MKHVDAVTAELELMAVHRDYLLRQAEQVIASMPSGLMLVDANLRILRINRAMCE